MNSHDQIDLYQVADRVFHRLAEEESIETLLKHERVFICVWALKGEVDNGGFDQYYFNASGDWAYLAPGALHTLGATATARLIERANSIFGVTGPNRDSELRHIQMDAFSAEDEKGLSNLEEAFYESSDSLDPLLADYVSANATLFGCE